ncbi:hypothetical protein C8R43DRAFT_1128336 [Mycena crocata]|nr:hypothetical protein C8R43DRAFT_1128336 [Mycena crocata]
MLSDDKVFACSQRMDRTEEEDMRRCMWTEAMEMLEDAQRKAGVALEEEKKKLADLDVLVKSMAGLNVQDPRYVNHYARIIVAVPALAQIIRPPAPVLFQETDTNTRAAYGGGEPQRLSFQTHQISQTQAGCPPRQLPNDGRCYFCKTPHCSIGRCPQSRAYIEAGRITIVDGWHRYGDGSRIRTNSSGIKAEVDAHYGGPLESQDSAVGGEALGGPVPRQECGRVVAVDWERAGENMMTWRAMETAAERGTRYTMTGEATRMDVASLSISKTEKQSRDVQHTGVPKAAELVEQRQVGSKATGALDVNAFEDVCGECVGCSKGALGDMDVVESTARHEASTGEKSRAIPPARRVPSLFGRENIDPHSYEGLYRCQRFQIGVDSGIQQKASKHDAQIAPSGAGGFDDADGETKDHPFKTSISEPEEDDTFFDCDELHPDVHGRIAGSLEGQDFGRAHQLQKSELGHGNGAHIMDAGDKRVALPPHASTGSWPIKETPSTLPLEARSGPPNSQRTKQRTSATASITAAQVLMRSAIVFAWYADARMNEMWRYAAQAARRFEGNYPSRGEDRPRAQTSLG